MKRISAILIAGMLIAVVAGAGIVSAASGNSDETGFFGTMYRWANNMRYNGFGSCPYFGPNAIDDGTYTTVEPEVITAEEAITIAEDETGQDIQEDNVYQMGRWWVFYYTDENDVVKQGRIDAYTGNVIEDFAESRTYQQQYSQNGRYMHDGEYGGSC
ncbi:MAG: PepSY domain-containing protein, partial [Methanosarcinaceae archaeon]|nr:PepSY domain-containing protein [Methanosarcinaceae archaeon]